MATRQRRRVIPAAAQEAIDGRAPTKTRMRYDAAGNGRRLAGWKPPSAGPNRALDGIEKIRNRARDVQRNDWSGKRHSQQWSTTLIGVGIVPRFNRVTNDKRRLEIRDLWEEWVAEADADGGSTFYGLQVLAVRAWLDAGEVFLRIRPRRLNGGLNVPLQVQLLEADFCPHQDFDVWPGMPTGHRIRQGIEFNAAGQRVAYWMYREHPDDAPSMRGAATIDMLQRVPAEFIRHIYEPERPGQLRGVSSLASVLIRLRNTGDLEDAVLDRQKLANLFTLFITRQMPQDWQDIEAGIDPDTGLPEWYNSEGTPVATLEAGTSRELAPGEDVKFANPPEAGTMFHEYMRTTVMGTAAGSGMPYELFSGDIRNVSDRTLRVLMIEFRRLARQRQWTIVIPRMCQPVVEAWALAGMLIGKIRRGEVDMVRKPEWSPDGFEHIHPVQDPQGKILEIEAGLRSRDSVIAENGDDPTQVDYERKLAAEREKKFGLEKPDPAEQQAQQQEKQRQAQPTALEAAQITMLSAQAEAARREPPAPAPMGPTPEAIAQMTANAATAVLQPFATQMSAMTQTLMGVVKTLAERGIEIKNDITLPATQIDVHPAAVQPTPLQIVNQNTVEVPPADLTVNAVLTMPDRESTTEVERDPKTGEIKSSRTVEKTVLQ